MRSEIKNQSGWIYIDALIGIVIISVAITALLAAYTQSTKATANTTQRTQAVYLAQRTLEALKTEDGRNGSINITQETVSNGSNNMRYRIKTEPINVPAGAGYTDNRTNGQYNLQAYQVTVSWPYDASGNEPNNVKMVGYGYYAYVE